MTFDNGPAPEPLEPSARDRQKSTNKRQGWLYVIIGVALTAVAILGLLAEDRGILDWLLLVLGLVNFGIGVMALRRPEPPTNAPEA